MKNLLFVVLIFSFNTNAQEIEVLTSGFKTSLRGLSVVDENILWASGSNGTIARSVDGGISWKWIMVKGFGKTDFRDIEGFDSSTAVIMGIAEPAYILRTTDGGETWNVVYENKTKGMFLDAMDFSDKQTGVVVGDPVNHKFFMARTTDGGNSWNEIPAEHQPSARNGEACFASSGTNLRLSAKGKVYFVSGGLHSRLFIANKSCNPPLLQGKESTGANSVALKNKRTLVITGGDFNKPDSAFKNCIITFNKGKRWVQPGIPPLGYRSCVEYINRKNWITCGLNGVDYSGDNGKTWRWISGESFHVCRKAKKGNVVYLAGGNGKIGKLKYPL